MVRTQASIRRARCGSVAAICVVGACLVIAEASCGFVSGNSMRVSFAGSKSRNARLTTAAAAPRTLDAAGKKYILDSIRHDLKNQFTDGFVYTPFAPGASYSTPFVSVRGRGMSEAMKRISPVSALHKFMVEDDSAVLRIKSIVEGKGDVNPFAGLASPPMGQGQDNGQGATWAIHAQWEMEAQGRVQLSPVIEQKPFYLTGHDVFRMDASGRVVSHERGFDQELTSVASYFNPIHHVPGLDSILPMPLAQRPGR